MSQPERKTLLGRDDTEPWIVYVIYHRRFYPHYHTCDPAFDPRHVHVIQASGYTKTHVADAVPAPYRVLKEASLPFYNANLQKNRYFAPSVLYHLYKNTYWSKAQRYIGFMEYDLAFNYSKRDATKLKLRIPNTSPLRYIKQHLNKANKSGIVIALSCRWRLQTLVKQRNITAGGKPWLRAFVQAYRSCFPQRHHVTYAALIKENPIVPTQQSFLTDVACFQQHVGPFLAYVIEQNLLSECCPMPATLLERFIGLCLHVSGRPIVYVPLTHHHHQGYRFETA